MSHAQKRPLNILMILVDDLNTWIGAYNERHSAKTPHLDRLAASSAFYRRAYCSAPYCNASRVGIFSGMRPSTTGVYHDEPLLDDTFQTLPEEFRRAGYYTFCAGKVLHGVFNYEEEIQSGSGKAAWKNVSNRDNYWSERHDLSFEPLPDGRPHISLFGDTPRSNWPPIYRHFDWAAFDADEAPDMRTSEQTIDFLKRQHDAPFFCCAGFYRPHLPWFAPSQYFDLYPLDEIILPVVKPDDLEDVPAQGVEFARWPFDHDRIVNAGQWRSAVRAYMACISYCDEMIGRVLTTLDQSAYRHNTVVVLVSDNGFHHGPKLHWSKFALWEEATRVPLMVRSPATTPGAVDHPVSLLDIFPTLLELTGKDLHAPLDGQSLPSPLLSNYTRRTPVISTWKSGNHSIRENSWRYTRYSDGGAELYDHRTDPYEWTNLIDNKDYDRVQKHLELRLQTVS